MSRPNKINGHRLNGHKKMDEDLVKKDEEASSAIKLALDTLDRGIAVARDTHRAAKRFTESVGSISGYNGHRLVAHKK